VWGCKGQELFFLDRDGFLSAAVMSSGATFNAGAPTRVLQMRYSAPGGDRAYDVSPDGNCFLMLKPDAAKDAREVPGIPVVVLNWREDLNRLAPTK